MARPSRGKRNPVERSAVESGWEPVWHGAAEIDATRVAGRLESDGIRAQVNGVPPESGLLAGSFDDGGYAVWVPASHAEHARELLTGYGEGGHVVESSTAYAFEPDDPAAISALRFVVIGLVVLAAIAAIIYVATS